MNLQNLMSQLTTASNPMSLMMSMLSPSQQQLTNQFKNKPTQQQAEEITKLCNEKGITKEQLQQIINTFKV